MVNIANLLSIPDTSACKVVNENCVSLIKHAIARKLRFMPAELVSINNFKERYGEAYDALINNSLDCKLSSSLKKNGSAETEQLLESGKRIHIKSTDGEHINKKAKTAEPIEESSRIEEEYLFSDRGNDESEDEDDGFIGLV